MGKITVKHYLNKRLKPLIIDNEKKYPLYVQVNYLGNNVQFKSEAFKDYGIELNYFSEKEFNNTKDIFSLLKNEIDTIRNLIKTLENYENLLDLSNLGSQIKELSKNVKDILEKKLFELFWIEAKEHGLWIPKIFNDTQFSYILEAIQILNNDYDSSFSEYYQNCKMAFEVFNNIILFDDNALNIHNMKLFEWKYGNGKKLFLQKGWETHTINFDEKDTEEYYKEVIISVDKLLI